MEFSFPLSQNTLEWKHQMFLGEVLDEWQTQGLEYEIMPHLHDSDLRYHELVVRWRVAG